MSQGISSWRTLVRPRWSWCHSAARVLIKGETLFDDTPKLAVRKTRSAFWAGPADGVACLCRALKAATGGKLPRGKHVGHFTSPIAAPPAVACIAWIGAVWFLVYCPSITRTAASVAARAFHTVRLHGSSTAAHNSQHQATGPRARLYCSATHANGYRPIAPRGNRKTSLSRCGCCYLLRTPTHTQLNQDGLGRFSNAENIWR